MRWRLSKLDWPYAVGELIIVTAGVLIALAIDQWNSDRLDRAEEIVLIDRFISDLRDDLGGISQGLNLSPAKEEHLLRLYSALSSEERPTDAAGFLEDVVDGAQYGWNQSSPRRNTLDEVLNAGRSMLIRDTEIRSKIADYYEWVEGEQNRIEERETEYPKLSYQLVPRVREFETDMELIETEADRLVERVFDSLLLDQVVAELNFSRFVTQSFTGWQRRCLELISELEAYRSSIE